MFVNRLALGSPPCCPTLKYVFFLIFKGCAELWIGSFSVKWFFCKFQLACFPYSAWYLWLGRFVCWSLGVFKLTFDCPDTNTTTDDNKKIDNLEDTTDNKQNPQPDPPEVITINDTETGDEIEVIERDMDDTQDKNDMEIEVIDIDTPQNNKQTEEKNSNAPILFPPTKSMYLNSARDPFNVDNTDYSYNINSKGEGLPLRTVMPVQGCSPQGCGATPLFDPNLWVCLSPAWQVIAIYNTFMKNVC